jgi:hypothetical protein
MADWWNGLCASWRLGGAVRLQKSGRLEEAKRALVDLDRWCDQRSQTVAAPFVSARMMSLIHLAETARQLGDESLARATLEKWLREHDRVVREPSLGPTVELARWEPWVRATLGAPATPAKP